MARTVSDPRARRTRLIISAAAIALLLLILTGVGIYGLIIGQPTPAEPTASASPPASADPSSSSPAEVEVAPLPETTDPEEFATAVAEALFAWDTFTLLRPQDHRNALLKVADPSGLETPGLAADLDEYLPTQDVWTQLQEYQTRQWLHIEDMVVPEQWHDAQTAGGNAIAEGTTAYTIDGVRYRAGIWHDKPVDSQHQIAFTIFLACEPAYDHCALLRLSALDEPLR